MKRSIIIALCLLALACAKEKKQEENKPECTSFLNQPLFAKPADPIQLNKSDSVIASIKNKGTFTEDDFVEIGKHLAATNRYRQAIENYTTGLSQFPQSFKLLRYRGHRYLNLREPESAIADLTKAEELIRGQPDIMEYDVAGKATDTYQHQIWYHIGIYHFFKRDYVACAAAFEKSLKNAHGGKNFAGASDWLYNAYQRAGQKERSAEILAPISMSLDIDDRSYPYFVRLLLYKKQIKPEEMVDINKPIEQMPLLEVTKLYGLANYYDYNGDKDKAMSLYNKVAQSKEWPAFAVACAELDLKEN